MEFNIKVRFARLTDEQIRNFSEEFALNICKKSLEKISNKQIKRIEVLNPALHKQIITQIYHAKLDPLYDFA